MLDAEAGGGGVHWLEGTGSEWGSMMNGRYARGNALPTQGGYGFGLALDAAAATHALELDCVHTPAGGGTGGAA